MFIGKNNKNYCECLNTFLYKMYGWCFVVKNDTNTTPIIKTTTYATYSNLPVDSSDDSNSLSSDEDYFLVNHYQETSTSSEDNY